MKYTIDPKNPTDEALDGLEVLKESMKFERGYLRENSFLLADHYYQHGAIYAARFWARIWMLVLAVEDEQYSTISRYTKGVWVEDNGDDEFVMMYG